MASPLSRRAFMVGVAGATTTSLAQADPPAPRPRPPTTDFFPQQERDAVREIVTVAHFDIDRVKALVNERPALVNAAWDLGFGDWETPLGAASHVGRREIAEFLISKGARVDLFAAAMLGRLDAVKAIIAIQPGIQRTRGPHGIPLLAHAEAGGKEAEAVAVYLKTLEGTGDDRTIATPDEAAKSRYLGTYTYGQGENESIEIVLDKQGRMELKRTGGSGRRLFVNGKDEFHPAGAPAVRIRFQGTEAKATRIEIVDGTRKWIATRRA